MLERGCVIDTKIVVFGQHLFVKENAAAEAEIDFSRMWLIRSGNLSLSIKLLSIWSEFLPIINTVSLTRPAFNHLTRLRSLIIRISDYYCSQLVPPIDTFKIAPRMTSLTVTDRRA